MLELKDKLAPPTKAREPQRGESAPAADAPNHADLLMSALTRMGYRPAEAERAVTALASRIDVEPLQVLVREALALLAPLNRFSGILLP